MSIPAIAVFDIGKTNKKFFLFDEDFRELHHEYADFEELDDDDGDPCDDLAGISNWMRKVFQEHFHSGKYEIKKLNFSTYGASLVHTDAKGKPITPLYNYLKPFPEEVEQKLFQKVDIEKNNLETASPYLGMLNSALQIYWLKQQKPSLFQSIKHSLHLPQYFSFLFTGKIVSELTSIGCHTKMWDFTANRYHPWIGKAGIDRVLPEVVPVSTTFPINIDKNGIEIGVGIHDSSAALVPYLLKSSEPFMLISTGTWSITLNPFTIDPLTQDDLEKDGLEYLSILGKPVKAFRLFLGNEFQQKVNILNDIFNKDKRYFMSITTDPGFVDEVRKGKYEGILNKREVDQWSPGKFSTYDEAYHFLCLEIAIRQKESIILAKGRSNLSKIYLDGGFVNNQVFVELLGNLMPGFQFEISSLPNGSAIGAAMVMKEQV